MALLYPSQPLSPRQHHINIGVLLITASVGVVLGLEWARECAAISSAYLGSFNYSITLAICKAVGMLGLPLLIYWRTRWFGGGLIAAGILSYAIFYGGMGVLLKEDRVAWVHEQMVEIGPSQKASAVIYFRTGITPQQVEDFNSSVLEESTSRRPGHGHPAFVRDYLRLAPMQANGHEAIALTFAYNTPADKVDAYLAKIRADSRVETVFLNRSPDSIHLDSEHP